MNDEKKRERIVRVTVVGDGYTGKTCLLIVYKDKEYNPLYVPTVFDSYSMDLPINGEDYRVVLQDTAGQEDYDKLRTFAYKETDVFILCYSVDNKSSFMNVKKWNTEIRHYMPKSKVILVATKSDLRDDASTSTTKNWNNFDDGLRMQASIGALDFIECSSKKLFNVNKVFERAILAAVDRDNEKKKRSKNLCNIL